MWAFICNDFDCLCGLCIIMCVCEEDLPLQGVLDTKRHQCSMFSAGGSGTTDRLVCFFLSHTETKHCWFSYWTSSLRGAALQSGHISPGHMTSRIQFHCCHTQRQESTSEGPESGCRRFCCSVAGWWCQTLDWTTLSCFNRKWTGLLLWVCLLKPEGGGGPQVCRAGVSVCFPDISSPLTADYLDQLVSGDQGYVGKQAGPTPAAQLGLESSFLWLPVMRQRESPRLSYVRLYDEDPKWPPKWQQLWRKQRFLKWWRSAGKQQVFLNVSRQRRSRMQQQ